MTEQELIGKIRTSMYAQCTQRGYAAPVDVLMDAGILEKKKYEDWRNGRVPYLEAVCSANLHRVSFVMRQIRLYAKEQNLKPSFCYYKQWNVKMKQGHKPIIPLRFCKSGSADIEKQYATHYVDQNRIAELEAKNRSESGSQTE